MRKPWCTTLPVGVATHFCWAVMPDTMLTVWQRHLIFLYGTMQIFHSKQVLAGSVISGNQQGWPSILPWLAFGSMRRAKRIVRSLVILAGNQSWNNKLPLWIKRLKMVFVEKHLIVLWIASDATRSSLPLLSMRHCCDFWFSGRLFVCWLTNSSMRGDCDNNLMSCSNSCVNDNFISL